MNDWISIEDKLPEPFVSVLIYCPEEFPLPTVQEGYLAQNGKLFEWMARWGECHPTHWMPMPEGPEEERDG